MLFSFKFVVITAAVAALYLTIKELVQLWRVRHEGSATLALGRLLIDDFLGPERVANIVHATIPTGFFISAFLMLKAYLPEIHPFQWDPAFMELDRALHFGFHPYQLLQPILGYPYVTKALCVAYYFWFFFMLVAWVVTAYARRDTPLRQRYLLAFTLAGVGWAGSSSHSQRLSFWARSNLLGTMPSMVMPGPPWRWFLGTLLAGSFSGIRQSRNSPAPDRTGWRGCRHHPMRS